MPGLLRVAFAAVVAGALAAAFAGARLRAAGVAGAASAETVALARGARVPAADVLERLGVLAAASGAGWSAGTQGSFPYWVRSPGTVWSLGSGSGPRRSQEKVPATTQRLTAGRAGDASPLERDGLGLSHCNDVYR